VLGLDGVLRCDARKLAVGVVRIPLSSQTPLEQALQTREFAVGQYQIGTLTGTGVLAFGYPVADVSGKIDAVAFASVRLDSLLQGVRQLPVPESGTVVLLDRDARVLASSDAEFPIGTKLPAGILEQARRQATYGDSRAGVPQVDPPDITALAVMPGYGGAALSVLVRAQRAGIVRSGRERLLKELEALGLLALLGSALAWSYGGRIIVAPTRQILRFTASLREGHLDARMPASGMHTEFADIATELNQMAHDLQQRTDALREAASASAQVLATRDHILDTMQEGVVAIDNDRNFLLFNGTARRLFGAVDTAADALSPQVAALSGLCHPDTGLAFRVEELPLFLALRGESGRDFDILVRNEHVPQGRLIRGSYGPIVGAVGIVGALAVFSDITAQRESEEEGRRSETELRETQRNLLEAQQIGRIGSWQA
jgi:PAS domain-containing protein